MNKKRQVFVLAAILVSLAACCCGLVTINRPSTPTVPQVVAVRRAPASPVTWFRQKVRQLVRKASRFVRGPGHVAG